MRFDDGTADAKSHADALGLCCEERIEYLVLLLRRQPHACVADRNHQLLIFRPLRLDNNLAPLIDILHCIDAVHDEVHYDLLHLHWICHDFGKIGVEFGADRNGIPICFASQKRDHLSNEFIDVGQPPLRFALLQYGADDVDPAAMEWAFFEAPLGDFFHLDLIFKVIWIERIDPSFRSFRLRIHEIHQRIAGGSR
jgi:hypothetical protein